MTMFLPGGGTIINHRNDYKRYRSTILPKDWCPLPLCPRLENAGHEAGGERGLHSSADGPQRRLVARWLIALVG